MYSTEIFNDQEEEEKAEERHTREKDGEVETEECEGPNCLD